MAPTRSSRPAFRSEAFAPSGELTWPLSLAEVARSCGLAGFSNRVQRNPGPVTGISEPGLGLFRARCSWGIYGPGLGVSRVGLGEFTGLAWGFLGSGLGNSRAWLGDFSDRTWGIYEADPGDLRSPTGDSTPGRGGETPLGWVVLTPPSGSKPPGARRASPHRGPRPPGLPRPRPPSDLASSTSVKGHKHCRGTVP